MLSDETFPQSVWYFTFLVALALAAPIADGTSRGTIRSGIDLIAGWVCGVLLAAYLVIDFCLVPYLVHLATAGVDAGRPLRLQRLEYFPNHYREGWFTFRVASGAFSMLLVATVCLVGLCRLSISWGKRLALVALYFVAIGTCGAFALWFYAKESYRITPDIAPQFARAAMFRDWLGAVLLLIFGAVVGAVRLTRDNQLIPSNTSSIRASGMVLMAVAPGLISLLLLLIESLRSVLSPRLFGGGTSLSELVWYLLSSPFLLLQLATGILALQIAWRWWRHGAPEIAILPIEPWRVFWAWLGLTALVIVGVPVLTAFGFSWWLGPWYL